jgi:hypothetical protein
MAKAARVKYRRLPGRSISLGHAVRIWEGPDHLLLCKAQGYAEEYGHLDFKDVQAMVVQTTNGYQVWSIVLGLLFALTMGWVLLGDGATGWAGWLAGLFTALWMIHLLRGATAHLYIQTLAGQTRITSAGRLATAEKILRRLVPLIEAAQGAVPREELESRLAAVSAAAGAPSSGPPELRRETNAANDEADE